MLDDNISIKMVLALLAAIVWTIYLSFPARGVATVDIWSTEKFGVWWIGKALMALSIIAAGIGFVLGGKGSFVGALTLFSFSVVPAVGGFFRSKM
jgi:hypothetical protein